MFRRKYKGWLLYPQNYFRWETLVRERGQEYDVRGFPSESDALKSLSEELLRLYK